MINPNVEHYVVRPNSTQGDWSYEYSSGSSMNNNCNCSEGLAEIANKLGILNDVVSAIKTSLEGTGTSTVDTQLITQIVNSKVSEALTEVQKEIVTINNKVENLPEDTVTTITNVTELIDEFKTWIEENTTKIETIEQYTTQLNTVTETITELQKTVATLSAESIKDEVLKSLGGNIDSAVENVISEKITELIGNQITELASNYTAVSKDIEDLKKNYETFADEVESIHKEAAEIKASVEKAIKDFNDHVNDTTVHVTAEEKAKWNAGTGSSDNYTFSVENEVLNISKS